MKSNYGKLIPLLLGCIAVTNSTLVPPHASKVQAVVKALPTLVHVDATRTTTRDDSIDDSLRLLGLLELSGGDTSTRGEDNEKETSKVLTAIAVGAVTATTGFLYGKLLGLSLSILWKDLPALLLTKLGSLNASYFIMGVMTFGGLLLGVLSSIFGTTFTVADFVHAFSSAPIERLPSSAIHLFPVLLMSLLTSAFGFSVGPEAPMVCAGALIGSSMSRIWYGKSRRHQEILSYAGAAGSLTAFMGIPIAGSIFAIEMTRSNAGLNKASGHSLSPSVISSIAAIIMIKGILTPSNHVGGHFSYGGHTIGALNGRAMIATAVACGAGGALLGTVFHKTVHKLKKVTWKPTTPASPETEEKPWLRQIAVKTLIGLVVGIISTHYPQTLFWGEGSLQSAIDGQKTPFANTKHGLVDVLTANARVDPNAPFADGSAALQVGIAKMIAIMLACIGKFPGGIIFPLFFAAAPFAHVFPRVLGEELMPVAVFCLMAATQASVTRTPLATVLILSLSASSETDLSVMLPASLVSSYLGVFFSRELSTKSYFSYNE
mmetsp:Transcript_34959/g.73742  ORF Transcript_34959/g.73742 Transcript_34959/m.73742 type:complete len:547 (-) Transcript_34959:71-1711(-)